MLRAALLLALVLAAPLASAQATLASLEEPHKGLDQVWPVTVTQEESARTNLAIFRNAPTSRFGLIIYDSTGAEVYVQNGTRGIQTLPSLAPGDYRFFVRGQGEFQVTEKGLEKLIPGNVSTNLRGADAYVLSPSRAYRLEVAGNVSAEFWNLIAEKEQLQAPFARDVTKGGAYVITVRGAEDTPYTLTLVPTEAPPTGNEAPGLGVAALALALGVAIALRRRT